MIFDVDGTLYDQRRLRRVMALRLLGHLCLHPAAWRQLRLLGDFRAAREQMSREPEALLNPEQYQRVARLRGVDEQKVRRLVEQWMHQAPLPHLAACRWPGVRRLFRQVKAGGRLPAVFSDYPAQDKLAALGLRAELTLSAEDPQVNRLKPHPAGLLLTAGELGLAPGDCLYIGDRDEHDGEAARRAGMPCLLWQGPGHAGPGFHSYENLAAELAAAGPPR